VADAIYYLYHRSTYRSYVSFSSPSKSDFIAPLGGIIGPAHFPEAPLSGSILGGLVALFVIYVIVRALVG